MRLLRAANRRVLALPPRLGLLLREGHQAYWRFSASRQARHDRQQPIHQRLPKIHPDQRPQASPHYRQGDQEVRTYPCHSLQRSGIVLRERATHLEQWLLQSEALWDHKRQPRAPRLLEARGLISPKFLRWKAIWVPFSPWRSALVDEADGEPLHVDARVPIEQDKYWDGSADWHHSCRHGCKRGQGPESPWQIWDFDHRLFGKLVLSNSNYHGLFEKERSSQRQTSLRAR